MEVISERTWDYIVVGTGMGGATLGHALASKGHSVLFIEKGLARPDTGAAKAGDFAETFLPPGADPADHPGTLAQAGRYPGLIDDVSATSNHPFVPFIGSGTGGSSALYGMALERFFPEDFSPGQHYPGAHGASVPETWPVNHDSMAHYYGRAESLFRVRGSRDPLKLTANQEYLTPRALLGANQALYAFFQNKGLHPYQLPMACEQVPGCHSCQGYLCKLPCKNDSGRICLAPAIRDFGASLLDQCTALRLHSSGSQVTALDCLYRGQPIALRARNYILAAGALETPRLLLESASSAWPQGLANSSGLVGKHLMRHYIDLYAVLAGERIGRDANVKELAFNDLYLHAGAKLGSVQSFGVLPPESILVEEIARDLRRDLGAAAATAFGLVKPIARFGLRQLFQRSLLLAATLEDLPYDTNRISLGDTRDADGRRRLQLHYRISNEEQARIEVFREAVGQTLRPRRFLRLKQADNNQRIAHACGTCRFGTDPRTSVCDQDHKAHGVDNLYIADSSVFPTSGGTNPALTIAALSLRLADHLTGAQQ